MDTRGWVVRVTMGLFLALAPCALADETIVGDLTVSQDAHVGGGLAVGSGSTIGGSTAITGNLTVNGDLVVTGNLTGVDTLSVDVRAELFDVVCASIKQDQVFRFDVSQVYGGAWTDTFSIIRSLPIAMTAYDGTVEKVVVYLDNVNAGWDSLTVDVFKTGAADTSLLDVKPAITPGICSGKSGADWVSSEDCGRAAVMDANEKDVPTTHVITMDAVLYGKGATPPTGLVVWVYFRPDY